MLTGIQLAELRRSGARLSLAHRILEPGHVLHSVLTCPSSSNAQRLKTRHPFAPAAQQLISLYDNNSIFSAHWADQKWNTEWVDNLTRLHTFILDTGTHTLGLTLPRKAWGMRLNCLRTGVGRFRSCLYKWGMASSAACECGAEEQTLHHVILQCPIHRPSHRLHGLAVLDDETIEWLLHTFREIWCGQAVDWKNSLKRRWIIKQYKNVWQIIFRNSLRLCWELCKFESTCSKWLPSFTN